MSTSFSILLRRGVAAGSCQKTILSSPRSFNPIISIASRSGFSTTTSKTTTKKEVVPEEDYYEGHLLADHLEYLDDMIEKTLAMESTMAELKSTYDLKRQALLNTTVHDDVEHLFQKAALQKEEIAKHLAEIKGILVKAKTSQSAFAVDGPDGTSDAQYQASIKEVDEIIDFASEHEDTAKIKKLHDLETAVKKDRARDPEHDW